MKSYFIPILLLLAVNAQSQQNVELFCSADSVKQKRLLEMLDSIEDFSVDKFYYAGILDKEAGNTSFCELLVYATIFDCFLKSGLDVGYNIKKNPPIINSTNLPTDSEFIKGIESNNKKFRLFFNFLEVKKEYEIFVATRYLGEKEKLLEQDVLNIIRYGIHISPFTLKDILLLKYKHLTRERMEKEWMESNK